MLNIHDTGTSETRTDLEPLLPAGTTRPRRVYIGGARTEKRVLCETSTGGQISSHLEDPADFRDGLRLGSLLRAEQLDCTTELQGAMGMTGKAGKCSLRSETLCRLRRRLPGQSCRWHDVCELAQRVSLVTGFTVVDFDPTEKKCFGGGEMRPTSSSESWENHQKALDELLSRPSSMHLRGASSH